jgi:hypothetical protein
VCVALFFFAGKNISIRKEPVVYRFYTYHRTLSSFYKNTPKAHEILSYPKKDTVLFSGYILNIDS